MLVVDDNATNRRILEHQLQTIGVDAQFTATGKEALAAMRTAAARGEAFEVAVLDMKLPDIAGLDLAQAVRADGILATIKLLMLTSQDVNTEKSTREAGIDVCLNKPVRQNELATALAGLFGVLPVAAAEVEKPTPPRTGRVLLVEDNKVNQRLGFKMLKTLGYEVIIANDGQEAVDVGAEVDFAGPNYRAVIDAHLPEQRWVAADGFKDGTNQ